MKVVPDYTLSAVHLELEQNYHMKKNTKNKIKCAFCLLI